MNSRHALLLLRETKLEETQESDDFTIRFKIKTLVNESDSTERSFTFTLQEFIHDGASPGKEEFCNFFIESVGEDEALSIFVDLILLAYNFRSFVGRGLRALLTFSFTLIAPSDELNNGVQEAFRESFDGTKARFRPASKLAMETLSRRTIEEQSGCLEEKCNICLESLVVGEKVASLACFHEFHDECLVKWLETSHVCPLCRFELPCEPEPEPEENRGQH